MRTLIIIGNGFDLAHGLKTDYASFIADIKNKPRKYGLGKIYDNFFLRLLSKGELNKNPNWSDIECVYYRILSHIEDLDYMMNAYYPKACFLTKKCRRNKLKSYDVELLNNDLKQVIKFFAKYLHEQVKIFEKNENYESFFKRLSDNHSGEDGDVTVLNFNYTNTVKAYTDKYPNIEVIHIHGELDGDKECEANPMILGYAADDDEYKDLLSKNDNQFVRNIKSFNYSRTGYDNKLKDFLSCEDESLEFKVCILGHSCGLSDKSILNQILTAENVNEIYAFYYAGSNRNESWNNYSDMKTNLEKIVSCCSKTSEVQSVLAKILAFPECFKIPQTKNNESFEEFLNSYTVFSLEDVHNFDTTCFN